MDRIKDNSAGDPRFLRHCSCIGAQAFIQKYPAITKRVVKTLIAAAKRECRCELCVY